MQQNTHDEIDPSLCGKVVKLEPGFAEVVLHIRHAMRADEKGLVHGGFIFGAADYAAMCAVNDPNVVLGSATSKFIAPVKVGDVVVCKATVLFEKGKKREVNVEVFVEGKRVFEGFFTAFVLERHVLD
jgi:acyl-coenzyme A thioesterase PaaI-like protein